MLLNDTIVETLKKLIATHGADLCTNWSRLEGLLCDHAGQHRREINILVIAAKQGIAEELLRVGSQIDPLLFNRLVRRLHEETGIAEMFAEWAVNTWMIVLGNNVHSTADNEEARREEVAPSAIAARPPIDQNVTDEAYQRARKILESLTGGIYSGALSPNGRYLAVSCHDRTLRYWDVLTQKELFLLKPYSYEGDAFGSSYWQVMTGNETNYRDPGFLIVPNVSKIIFSPDGRYLAFSGTVVYLWEIGVEQQAWQLRRLAWNVNDIAFSPDGGHLAIGGGEPEIELWDVKRRRVIWEVAGIIGIVEKLAFSTDGQYILSVEECLDEKRQVLGDIHGIRMWNVINGYEVWRYTFTSQARPGELSLLFEGRNLIVKDSTEAVQCKVEPLPSVPLSNPLRAHMWNGRRMWHPWDWADPEGALPEQNAEVRKIAEERYMLYLKSKGMAK
jgi:WD40 repeat protein